MLKRRLDLQDVSIFVDKHSLGSEMSHRLFVELLHIDKDVRRVALHHSVCHCHRVARDVCPADVVEPRYFIERRTDQVRGRLLCLSNIIAK